MTANAEYWRDKALAAEARVAELEAENATMRPVVDAAVQDCGVKSPGLASAVRNYNAALAAKEVDNG